MHMLSTYENISTALFVAAGALAAIAAVLFFALHIWQVIGKLAGTRWAKTDEQVYELPKSAPPRRKDPPPRPVSTARKGAPPRPVSTARKGAPRKPQPAEPVAVQTVPMEPETPAAETVPMEQQTPVVETVPMEQESTPAAESAPEAEADRRSDVEEAKRRLGFRPMEKILVVHTQERI